MKSKLDPAGGRAHKTIEQDIKKVLSQLFAIEQERAMRGAGWKERHHRDVTLIRAKLFIELGWPG